MKNIDTWFLLAMLVCMILTGITMTAVNRLDKELAITKAILYEMRNNNRDRF